MGEDRSNRGENIAFASVGSASVLPIAGYFLLEWSFTALVLLFWLEAMTVILCYAWLGLIATPEATIADDGMPGRSDRRVPELNSENLEAVAPETVLGVLIATAAGGSITVWGVGRRAGRETDESVVEFFAQFTVFQTPSVFVAGVIIVGIHVFTLSRYYVGTGRYRELTENMAIDVQMKYYGCYLLFVLCFVLYAVAMFLILGFALEGVVSDATGLLLWELVVAGSFLVSKLAFERSRFRGERRPDLEDDSFTANFSPTPPSREDDAV